MMRFNTGISPHEELFNAPFGVSLKESQSKARVEEVVNARERFKNYLVRPSTSLDAKIQRSELTLKDLASDMEPVFKQLQAHDCSQTTAICPERTVIEQNVDLLRDQAGGDLLFANGVLSIAPKDNDVLEITFRFHAFEGPEFLMCVDRATGEGRLCNGQQEASMSAVMDLKSGSFQIQWRGLFRGKMDSMLIGREHAKQVGQIDYSELPEQLEDNGCYSMTLWSDTWRSPVGTELSTAFRGKLAIYDGDCVGKPVRTGSVLLRQTQLELLDGLERLRQKRTEFLAK